MEDFAAYAEAVFRALRGRVRWWVTMNEPWSFCVVGLVMGKHAPGKKDVVRLGPTQPGKGLAWTGTAAPEILEGAYGKELQGGPILGWSADRASTQAVVTLLKASHMGPCAEQASTILRRAVCARPFSASSRCGPLPMATGLLPHARWLWLQGAAWRCIHHVLLAHGAAVQRFRAIFPPGSPEKISMVINSDWFEPRTQTTQDVVRAPPPGALWPTLPCSLYVI